MADIEQILKDSTTIAVLFANPRTSAPAYYVPAYLAEQGYRVYPIHPAPAHADKVLFGQPMLQRLDQVPEPIDLLDMFRRAEAISDHVDDILALDPLPRVVWFQLGLRNEEAAARLEAAGITVVQDRCTLADHQNLGIATKNRG